MLSLTLLAFGAALSSPVSDGDRFVALQRTPQTIEIRDDVKHLKRTLNLACAPVSISRGGTLLTECGPQDYVAVDLLSGARTPVSVPFDAANLTASSSRAVAAGREWVSEEHSGYHWGHRLYRNLRTGEVRRADQREAAVDLDSPALTPMLCAPVQRLSQAALESSGTLIDDRWAPFDSYDGQVAAFNAYDHNDGGGSYGLLWRCGDTAPRRIDGALGLSAGGGWATWFQGGGAWAERVSTRKRVRVRGAASVVVHTRTAIYTQRGGGKVFRGRFSAAS